MISRLLRFAIVVCAAAVALPARAIATAVDLFSDAFAFVDSSVLRSLFDEPTLALEGPRLGPIEPSLLQRQRHEAGLARLGSVRHI